MKKQKGFFEDEVEPKFEGCVDYERSVFVVTRDDNNLVNSYSPKKENKTQEQDIREMFKKYRPECVKLADKFRVE